LEVCLARRVRDAGSGEDRLIARHFTPLATAPGAFALTDDAAVLEPPAGCDLVLKTDAIVGGVHFFDFDPPDMIGKKALRVNLSDLAAKAAKPLGFLLTLALPGWLDDAWLEAFARGLGADTVCFECPLLGGDTVRTPGPVAISIAVFGAVPHGRMLRRAGARSGDRLVVTGTIGDAALGVALRRDRAAAERWRLTGEQQTGLERRYLLPQPRNALAEALGDCATAAMDVSDGLAGDLAKLCRASGVSAEIDVGRVPLSEPARTALGSEPALIERVLTGGDDYEVLASIPPGRLEALRERAATSGIALTDIGVVVTGDEEPRLLDRGRRLVFAHSSFSHFDR
jgi:thiamine-monophosphate kinase